MQALGEYLTSDEDEMRSKGKPSAAATPWFYATNWRRGGFLIDRRRFPLRCTEEVFSGFIQSPSWYASPAPLVFYPEVLPSIQVRVLTTFYCGKLDDTETIVPSLDGLATLVTLPQFTASDALEVVKAFVLNSIRSVL